MTDAHRNFSNWYVKTLKLMYPDRDAGFPIAMIAFPLLERYGRQRLGIGGHLGLETPFYVLLPTLIPALIDANTARTFWSVYRNGLLHEITLGRVTRKGAPLPIAWLSHDKSLFEIDHYGDYWLHPVLFAERVVEIIESDFQTFESGAVAINSLPEVHAVQYATGTGTGAATVAPLIVTGTNSGP